MNTSTNDFRAIAPHARCGLCLDTDIHLTTGNQVAVCPNLFAIGAPHRPANPSAYLFVRAAMRLQSIPVEINPFAFALAQILTAFQSENPCKRLDLLEFFFGDTNLTPNNRLRKFHEMIEQLRKIWLLPIGSRKDRPSGYWIITELEDFKIWFDRSKTAPITQLSTIHRVARHNFPVLAEQLELEFWTDFKQEAQ